MPENLPNLPPVPETDLTRIAAAVNEHRERGEAGTVETPAPHESIRAVLQSMAGAPTPPQTSPATTAAPQTSATLPDYLADAPAAARAEVEHLVTTAQTKGIDAAHAEAQKQDPFILDAFHDVMTGKLYSAFKDRGLMQ